MSTKTTFKRIALVAVAALGFGMLSVVPSGAAAVVIGANSTGYSLNATSITMVDETSDATPGNDNFVAFEVSITNSNGYAAKLQSGESLTATVVGNPGNGVVTANTDVELSWASAYTPSTGAATAASYGTTKTITSANDYSVDLNLATAKRGGTGTSTSYTVDVQAGLGAATATYALMVAVKDAKAFNAGAYTIRIDLLDANGNAIKTSSVKYLAANSKITSGAVVTTTVTGSQLKGAVVASSTTASITASLKDANGGLVRTGANAAPTISASITDSSTTPVVDALTMTDAGTDANNDTAILDGVYVATSTSSAVIAGVAGAATVKSVFGASSSSAAL